MTPSSSHVILGGNGVVGRETIRALAGRGHAPVSVGRRPLSSASSVPSGEAVSLTADLLDSADVASVMRGADVAYLTVGLPYSSRIWAQQWPQILANTIAAALENGTHLVYFDNVYAYGAVAGPMTESTPIHPISRKGRVRADALGALEQAADRGLVVTIARSADFYGPGATTSVFNGFALNKIAAGRPGTWLFDADLPHSLTYTPDIGDALATLGTDPRGRGRTWHVPTTPALTGREYIELAAGPAARPRVMSSAMMRMGALFNGSARETLEMAYQYTAPYFFDSSAFEATFGVTATPVTDGIAASLAALETEETRATSH
jgi:nucleoside-diphosphate-sugar epimerase